ncbi:unnamed protein product [Knipowitschia caucasica]|uniref:Thrombopoietin n=2 Tax=Knipowitschia caucasica TaxID=637954 RepID=A0AAV2J480_KNICA
MAYSSFVLLVMGVLSCPLPAAESRPEDFWCKPEVRANRRQSAEAAIDKMIDCQSSVDVQAAPVPCPFVGINHQRWNNLTVLERFSETVSDLQLLHEGLEDIKNVTSLSCRSLFEDIQLHMRNNRAILLRQIQNATAEASSPPQTCSGLTEALRRYQKLLLGKLELFVKSYGENICNEETTDSISNR